MLRAGTLASPELQALVDKIGGIEKEIEAEQAVIAEKKAEIEKIKAEDQPKPAAEAAGRRARRAGRGPGRQVLPAVRHAGRGHRTLLLAVRHETRLTSLWGQVLHRSILHVWHRTGGVRPRKMLRCQT